MVCVQDQEFVDGSFHNGVDRVFFCGQGEHHLHEVATVVEVVRGVHGGVPHVVLVCLGRQRRQLCNQSVNGEFNINHRTVGVLRLRVEGAQTGNHGTQHAHGMCTRRERLKEALHVLVHQGMLGDAFLEIGELLSIRQIAVNEQVGNL